MKTYVLTLSKVFPKTHNGQENQQTLSFCSKTTTILIRYTQSERIIRFGNSVFQKFRQDGLYCLSGNGQEIRTEANRLKSGN